MTNSPILRVAVVQDEPEVVLSCDRPAVIMSEGRVVSSGPRGSEFRIKIKTRGETEPVFRVYLRDFDDSKAARSFIEDFPLNDLKLEEVRIGRSFEVGGKTVHDNTGVRVLAGEFEGEKEARESLERLRSEGFRPWISVEFVPGSRDRLEVKGTFGIPLAVPPPVSVVSEDSEARFSVFHVPVGQGFHWEHREDLTFRGALSVHPGAHRTVTVVNDVPLEDYLASVNSSEMPAEAPPELLKAQTVAARGTVLATAGRHHHGVPFDLCSTDHCQVYLGESVIREASRDAVRETFGEVLEFDGTMCDPRYSKICGGVTERFENVWSGDAVPYMSSVLDGPESLRKELPEDLAAEEGVRAFITSTPACYCNTGAHDVPCYLEKLGEHFRWALEYDPTHLGSIVFKKTNRDIGRLQDLKTIRRGPSGRILEIEAVGSKSSMVLQPELEIRCALSESHLPSSAFVVDLEKSSGGMVKKIHLTGAGWGHGVGMCQVGAAVMAHQGKDYKEILRHYYRGAELQKLY
jgi:peptidoglycan hydrolase-like amidase